MSKYKDYLTKKYGSPKVSSRFETAKIQNQERDERAEKIRKQQERRKRNIEAITKIVKGEAFDPDDYWLQLDLPDGRTILFKDGKQYDIDTGEEIFILW